MLLILLLLRSCSFTFLRLFLLYSYSSALLRLLLLLFCSSTILKLLLLYSRTVPSTRQIRAQAIDLKHETWRSWNEVSDNKGLLDTIFFFTHYTFRLIKSHSHRREVNDVKLPKIVLIFLVHTWWILHVNLSYMHRAFPEHLISIPWLTSLLRDAKIRHPSHNWIIFIAKSFVVFPFLPLKNIL